MFGVEVSGFLPYIDSRRDELDRIVAGLCLDSVGQDFSICGGEFVLFRSPETNASFIDGLMEHLFGAVTAEPIARFSSDNYATFPWHTEPFWGNDAFVSDGFFDIPTPQISGWPHKFYHSSMDTPDQMSENTLGRAGAIAGTYLYLLATAGSQEALWVAGLAARDWKRRICDVLAMEALKDDTVPLHERASRLRALGVHLGLQGNDAVKQVLRFAPDDSHLHKAVDGLSDDMKLFASRESKKMIELASAFSGQEEPPLSKTPGREVVDQRGTTVMRRLRWRAPAEDAYSEDGQAKLRALLEREGEVGRVWSWLNGRRTIQQVWERVQYDGSIPYDAVADYLDLLVAEGFAASVEP